MNLHNQIMNIPVPSDFDYADFPNKVYAYKSGHRDARHASAELSLNAEARIEELEEALRYVIECNDVAMPDPVCEQWMGSPCRAECVKVLESK